MLEAITFIRSEEVLYGKTKNRRPIVIAPSSVETSLVLWSCKLGSNPFYCGMPSVEKPTLLNLHVYGAEEDMAKTQKKSHGKSKMGS